MATGIFSTLFQERMPGVKFPWPYSGSKKTPSFDSPWFGRSYGAFAIVYPSLVTLLWFDSPLLPKSSGTDPKRALVIITSK